MHIIKAHRRASDACTAIVSHVRPDDLDLPTPCAGWDLRRLLGHVIGQNHGFAAAVRHDVPVDAFAERQVGDDVVRRYRESAAAVEAAFAACDPDRTVLLPEFGTAHRFEPEQVMGFHLLDSLVHGWDVATALGGSVRYDDDLVAEALARAMRVPGGAAREVEGAAFGPTRPAAAEAGDWDRTLALLGREAAR